MVECYAIETKHGVIVTWKTREGNWDVTVADVNHIHPLSELLSPRTNLLPFAAFTAILDFVGGNEVGEVYWGKEYRIYVELDEVLGPDWADNSLQRQKEIENED